MTVYLRACVVTFADDVSYAGVGLPDGRILIWKSQSSMQAFHSEHALCEEYPGARVDWLAEADGALNFT